MAIAVFGAWAFAPAAALASCGNAIQCENQLPGDPPSDWEVDGAGDSTIQGFATQMGVNPSQTESFKVNTPSTQYHIDILRLGYYGGNGARKVATILPSAALPQSQPACLDQANTGLIDCGNWAVSAQWTVPSTAVSGLYIAHLVRDDSQDPGGASQIPFVVRDDSSHSGILLQTSDASWEAYNDYGGNDLYTCSIDCPPGSPHDYLGAASVSYNRPFDGTITSDGGRTDPFYAEYQLIRFAEANGYDVSYTNESNVDGQGSLLKNHKLFISSGHDEYWSSGQRQNVQAALAAGVSLAFFSGNEMFWKTRWSSSVDGSSTPYRTLTTYKETHFDAPVDPQDPPTWTGTWADPRFSPPADGGIPTNALTGQQFLVNSGSTDITVPWTYSQVRFWRNTAVAGLSAGQSAVLAQGQHTLGYEWDLNMDNGFRPAGEFNLSSTTASGLQTFTDYGSGLTSNSTETHHLTLYRAPSGALVFGAGTVQWSWGLDNTNDFGPGPNESIPPDPTMRQATVNLFADMGVQPTTLLPGLVAAAPSTNTTPPASTITSPSANANLQHNSAVTISGTATDPGGGVVTQVDVSTDGGATWHAAAINGADATTVNWSYAWAARSAPTTTIMSRAVDDGGNVETPSAGVTVNVSCPCSLWASGIVPQTVDSGDGTGVTVGMSFTSDINGTVTGIRFYKSSANTGTHVGGLYNSSGVLLASATFTSETASGWQQVNFSSPVTISANTQYVAAYYAPNGHYSADIDYWLTPSPLGGNFLNSPPLHAVPGSASSSNGWYSYGSSIRFPSGSFQQSNYWVDPVFAPASGTGALPGQVTGVSATAGDYGASLTWTAPTTGGPVANYVITPYVGAVAQPTTTVAAPATSANVAGLSNGTTYTFTVQATNPNGSGPVSATSNAVTPNGPPLPPTAPSNAAAIAASSEAQVSWSPSFNGGSAITSYTVTPFAGSAAGTPVQVSASSTSAVVTGLTNGTAYTFQVTATNSVGTSPASAASNAVTPEDTIFDFSTPATIDSNDRSGLEVGVKFTSTKNGTVTGIRFYKSAANVGTHIGNLWDSSGNPLASATFTSETATGWQQVNFSSPVSITAGTTYVAGYYAPYGHYSVDDGAFRSNSVTNGPLSALANSTSVNGVYSYSSSSAFPTSTYGAANYWVDVDFQPAPPGPITAPTNVTAQPATKQVQVSWTPPSSDGGSTITSYTVTPSSGPPVTVPGSATTATITGLQNGTGYTFTVTATNGNGNGPTSSPSASATPADTIFDFSTPAVVDSGDGGSITVGVKFTSDTSGTVTGIRFYKATTNTGTHVGSLWDASGNLLASATFSNETPSGWQTVSFSSPVTISAGTTYVAGYFAPSGHYADTDNTFSSGSVNNPPLHGIASSTSPNGVYAYGSSTTYPTSTYNAANYWVDVEFQPAAASPPGAPTNVTATPASGQAQVSWTPPASSGSTAISGYTVTPYAGSAAGTPVQVGGSSTQAVVTGLTNGTAYTFNVTATNATGTGPASSASSAVTPNDTIFDFGAPSAPDSGDGSSTEVGVKFTADSSGTVLGIRFFKASANTGTHVGSLWTASGTLLATATFTNETASGWQMAYFSSPVGITAGATYIAAYLAPNGHYSATSSAFASGGVDNPPLHAVANSTSANGVYAYSSTSTFPTNTFSASNYWVDVDFQAGGTGPPSAPTGVSATPASSEALVSWTPPANAGSSSLTGYTVTPISGGTAGTPVQVGGSTTQALVTGLTNGAGYTFTVTATNSSGAGPASAATSAVTPQDTILDLATPATADSGDASSTEVGVNFNADVNGTVTGIRFYKSAANTGTHVGSLWSSSGALLASGTFSNETASGWQTMTFSTPVAITAGSTYVAGYLAPRGHYSENPGEFASTGVDNAPLHALAATTVANGVFSYTSTPAFPSSSFNATNYWVDVGFQPGGTSVPAAPTGVSATGGNAGASVSWTAPASSGGTPITSYTVTPYVGSTAQPTTTVSGSATSANVTGLTNGTAYTFTVQASNAIGTGSPSSASNAVTPSTVPGAPSGVFAAPGNASAIVVWTAPANGGSAITGYTVTPYIGSAAQAPTSVSGSATSANVTGLTNGTAYTFTVTATNANGAGSASTASNAVTPSTVPSAPTGVSATAGPANATVTWTAPPNGGSAITSYSVTPYVGATAQPATVVTGSPPATSVKVVGLTSGTAYTFKVTATNANGAGPASAASAAITPTVPTPAFVQQASTHLAAVTSGTVSPPANISTANRLIVTVGVSGAGVTAKTVADSAGNAYTEVQHFTASNAELSVWSAPITAGGGTRPTITVTPSAKANLGIAALEYSGLSLVSGAAVVDQAAQASGTSGLFGGTATSGATAATTSASELALGTYVDPGKSASLSAKSPFSKRVNLSPESDVDLLSEDQVVGLAARPNAGVGTGSLIPWLMSTVVFKHG